MARRLLLVAGWWLAVAAAGPVVRAQAPGGDADSVMLSYDLEEIVVQSGGVPVRPETSTVQRVSLAELARADAASVDQVVRLIPGAHIQTNSRGETLVYLRNAGERQVALFFDGALLNIPWDHRFDLGLVPAGVVGRMTVAKGVPSVLYGTNVLGGAVNLTARRLPDAGSYTEATGMGGDPAAAQARLTHLGRTERLGYTLSAGYHERDGAALPDGAELPFSQPGDDLRTNTDERLVSLFGQATYELAPGRRVGVSVLHLDGEKGVAPESHLDPQVARVRFWRYPEWRTTMAILSGQTLLGARGGLLRGAAWVSRFGQTIDQFGSVAYRAPVAQQEDEDRTLGTRLVWLRGLGAGEIRLALNALTSEHRQRDTAFEGTATAGSEQQTFRQHVWSFGSEYEWTPSEALGILAGASLDGIATPETGDKPPREAQADVGVSTGLRYALAPGWTLRAAAGRKVRFPTMRELFGESLGRFLVNPDLRAESSLLAEGALVREGERASGEAVVFVSRTFDTIDQRSVRLPGEERPRRQRVNLDGSRVVGIEVAGAARPRARLALDGSLTVMRARGFEDGTTRRLAEKPAALGTLTATQTFRSGFSALLQTVYTGVAYSPDEDDVLQRLDPSLVVNARVGYQVVGLGPLASAQLYARVNNLGDAVVLPQLGLPAPGREVRFGLEVSF
ncbi:MAG: TonB-dependent receptor [Rhodothermales bacterium]|nr:TonB-dependent receptor [Rhodothermales bacterium]